MDTWVPVRVSKEEIPIEDTRPYSMPSRAPNFPGYYIVDPTLGFARVPEKGS